MDFFIEIKFCIIFLIYAICFLKIHRWNTLNYYLIFKNIFKRFEVLRTVSIELKTFTD